MTVFTFLGIGQEDCVFSFTQSNTLTYRKKKRERSIIELYTIYIIEIEKKSIKQAEIKKDRTAEDDLSCTPFSAL